MRGEEEGDFPKAPFFRTRPAAMDTILHEVFYGVFVEFRFGAYNRTAVGVRSAPGTWRVSGCL